MAMKLRLLLFTVAAALAAGAAFAHGSKVHILGTIEKINADTIRVQTKEGKSVEVKLVRSTVYLSRSNNQDQPAKLSDLAAGQLVAIHAAARDNVLEAEEIKFSVPAGPKLAAPAAKPKP